MSPPRPRSRPPAKPSNLTPACVPRWDSIVKEAIDKSEGVRRLCSNGFAVSLLGMHSNVHPAVRMHWKRRLVLSNLLPSMIGTSGFSSIASSCIVQFKESMRRMLSNCISPAYASVHAMRRIEHPSALLHCAPLHMPNPGMESACTAFARAGSWIVDARGDIEVTQCVKKAFDAQACVLAMGGDGEALPRHLTWNASYLGAPPVRACTRPRLHVGCGHIHRAMLFAAGKGTASIHSKVPAVAVAADVWGIAFRCSFIPFWVHSSGHKLRASRLDPVQHSSIHGLNAATKLTLLLSENEALGLQRVALQTPSSGIMTLEEVAELNGVSGVRGSSCNGGSKGPIDAVRAVGDAGPKNAAKILSFCRAAWVSEELLIYDLGIDTARRQADALLRRLLIDEFSGPIPDGADPLDYLDLVPDHSRNLCACIECKRVANAVVCDAGSKWRVAFNEIGTSGSMVSTSTDTGKVHLRCAKRSSASLRTAVAFEEEMSTRAVECDANDDSTVSAMIVDNFSGKDSGVAARVRRDSKSALEQRVSSVACGADVMLSMPIVGKVVRLWGEWYSLCCFCGCFVRFYPSNRAGSQICCLRCDYSMLHRSEARVSAARTETGGDPPRCRFCSKQDPMRTGARWRMVRAPMDATGHNANIPPPLRTVHFCPQHFRPWIPTCLKTMPMRIILSHIVYGARPCFGGGQEAEPDKTKPDKPAAKRRRIVLKKRA